MKNSRNIRAPALLLCCIGAFGPACREKVVTDGYSDTEIQASILGTADVGFIDITVRLLSDNSRVYYSGIQPAENHFVLRRDLMRTVELQADTEFLFQATVYDQNMGSPITAMDVQKRTLGSGQQTKVTIVLDLNVGEQSDGGVTSGTDIIALTDHGPLLYPPTIEGDARAGHQVTISYAGTDADWGVDSNETMTFFTTVLSGTVDGSAGLFNLGQSFTFTPQGSDPIKVLCGVLDHYGRIGYDIMNIDPITGAFALAAQGEGFGAMPTVETLLPKRAALPEESGQLAFVALKRGGSESSPATIQVISDIKGDHQVMSEDVAFWNGGTLLSLNRYENQVGATTPFVYKMRVRVPTGSIIDSIKLIPNKSLGGEIAYSTQVQEGGAILNAPAIATGELSAVAGTFLAFKGTDLEGLSTAVFADGPGANANVIAFTFDVSQAPASKRLSGEEDANVWVPTILHAGDYYLSIYTYGRLGSNKQLVHVGEHVEPGPEPKPPELMLLSKWDKTTGWTGPNGNAISMVFETLAGATYKCRSYPVYEYDRHPFVHVPAFKTCNPADGMDPSYSASPNADKEEGTYLTDVQAVVDDKVMAETSYRYYVHHSLDGVDPCVPKATDEEFFTAARTLLVPALMHPLATSSAFKGKVVTDNPFVSFAVEGANYNNYATSALCDTLREDGSCASWTDPVPAAKIEFSVLTLRRRFVLADKGDLLLVTRSKTSRLQERYVKRRVEGKRAEFDAHGFLCRNNFVFGWKDFRFKDMTTGDDSDIPNPSRSAIDCAAVVMNSQGQGVCLEVVPNDIGERVIRIRAYSDSFWEKLVVGSNYSSFSPKYLGKNSDECTGRCGIHSLALPL